MWHEIIMIRLLKIPLIMYNLESQNLYLKVECFDDKVLRKASDF